MPAPIARPEPGPPRGPVTSTFDWRDRIPEVIATIGASLVALAVTGFLVSRWDVLDQIEKAMVLGVAAAAVTAAGLWADRGLPVRFEPVVGLLWATGSMLTAAAVTLATSTVWPGVGRATIAAGGVAGAVHASAFLMRRPGSILQQGTLFASVAFAAGPTGTEWSDRIDADVLEVIGWPLAGLFDPTITSDAFLVVGPLHLLIGIAWLGLARVLIGYAATVAAVLGTVTVGFAALELNVLTSPVGSVAALAVVLGYLIYGLWAQQAGLVVAGVAGTIVAGVRVLAALFSGEMAATLIVFGGGIVMLGWAARAVRVRGERGRTNEGTLGAHDRSADEQAGGAR